MSSFRRSKRVEDLDNAAVQDLLKRSGLEEFQEFARVKELDGRKLVEVTEGLVKLWKPRINANKLILFIEEVKSDPYKLLNAKEKDNEDKYKVQDNLGIVERVTEMIDEQPDDTIIKQETMNIESQYQTVKKKKDADMNIDENNENYYQTVKKVREYNSFSNIDELLKKIVPAKSFLYRNQAKKPDISYLPMSAGPAKKRKLFGIYDYPTFDLKRHSKPEGDRGYYPMKRNSKYFIVKIKTPDTRPRYNSISTTDDLKYPEDHFYEDLCYNDVTTNIDTNRSSVSSTQSKPYRVKIQELFQSFKIPFFKKTEDVEEEKKEEVKEKEVDLAEEEEMEPMYENSESAANMYDSVHVRSQEEIASDRDKTKLPVEDYLEPVQLTKDYCDVTYKQKDDSLLGYIMSIFESRFGIRRESSDVQGEESEPEPERGEPQRMSDRPLPVPVESEPYYMEVDRLDAENLLRGQPDGTFVLRPSSQSSHAYSVSVSCAGAVHNVGVRRRPDGRLALGFARKGERSFTDISSLVRHHRRRRMLLVARGGVLGATTLNETAHYYHTPKTLIPNTPTLQSM